MTIARTGKALTLPRRRGSVRVLWLTARGILSAIKRRVRPRVRVLDATRRRSTRGALLSYLAAPVRYAANDRRLAGHTNAWECRTIGAALEERGLALDAIDWSDDAFDPRREYEVIVDLHRNLERIGDRARRRWLHITGSHPRFAYEAERRRLDALAARRGTRLRARRAFDSADTDRFDRSLEMADIITIVGDDVTCSTFASPAIGRAEKVYVTGSPVAPRVRDDDFDDRTFLWFAGSGAVHKGFDLVLEAFAANPRLTLHCVGPYEQETDFVAAFRRELYETPNIISHGWMVPSDRRFAEIARRAFAFVMPSCSEGMSPAAVTCMQFGLLPIVTRRCGLDLPAGIGRQVDDDAFSLGSAIGEIAEMSHIDLAEQISRTRALASNRHSREAFQSRIGELMKRNVRPSIDA